MMSLAPIFVIQTAVERLEISLRVEKHWLELLKTENRSIVLQNVNYTIAIQPLKKNENCLVELEGKFFNVFANKGKLLQEF